MHESRKLKFSDICRTGAAIKCLKSGQRMKDVAASAGKPPGTVRRWVSKAGFKKKGGDWRHVSEARASRIVSTLLEDGPVMQRVCSACEKELGIRRTAPDPNITHGLCQRHTIEYFGERGRAQVQRRPPEDFAPDLAQQQQQSAPPKASFAPNPGYAA